MSRQAQPCLLPPDHTSIIPVHAQRTLVRPLPLKSRENACLIGRVGLQNHLKVLMFSGTGSERRRERQQQQLGGAERGQDNRTLADAVLRRGARTHAHTHVFFHLFIITGSHK